MLSENEFEPFLKESDNVPVRKSGLSRQTQYGRLGSLRDWSCPSSTFLPACIVFTFTSLLWGCLVLLIIYFSPQIPKIEQHENSEVHGNLTTDAKFLTCSNSIVEAKNSGCHYDILSNHWLPDICMDQESITEYQSDGSWFGYADENRTELLSIDAMSKMPFYYTSMRDHIVHCGMLWRKQYRAFFEQRKNIDAIIADKSHTMHCSQFLIDMSDRGTDFWNVPIRVYVGKAGCWIRD